VSQFTLYATLKGNKPDFHKAMEPEKAKVFYDAFVKEVRQNYKSNPKAVQDGVFGAMMQVWSVQRGKQGDIVITGSFCSGEAGE